MDTREGPAVPIVLEDQELVVVVRWRMVNRKLYRISARETKEDQSGDYSSLLGSVLKRQAYDR